MTRLRALLAAAALVLAMALTGCSDTNNCDDQTAGMASVAAAAPLKPGGSGGSRGGSRSTGTKPKAPKFGSHSGGHHTTVHVDDCDDEEN
ncbi:hypothetical protein [Streptomyces olivaceiscleroticus]|uniref:Lipoprotein n=1 Tax=Streptomyces olivaceiscleroticus TaxID=68245 RepID=A0ABP3LHK7_9ACTN